MQIKTLFDSNKNIYRTIEKVITYGVSQESRLKTEISEYVVTDNIEDQFNKLLTNMQIAMDAGGENEVGVWISGFYGSGKSSFSKYLGLSFDENIKIDGIPFIQHLQNRFKKSTTKALLSSVAKRFPAAVLLLDLASEQVAGSNLIEVSTVLYYKVLQWAGYSRNLKVAMFERKLKKDHKYNVFLELFKESTKGQEWKDFRDDELVIDSLIPEIAHKMYPTLFKTNFSFSTEASEVIRFEDERVAEMIEIAREATGKEYIIFIIDEVGQYVGPRSNLILNLDGLSKNLKNIGNGKVWIIGTAQQTLTEDNPKSSLNSPELYKLKDRFPIQIDLEANDIKEICYTRLLGKSPSGESELDTLYDNFGQMLRHNTRLVDARFYGADFDKKTFVNLYPFLPAHFDILLHLLGSLAKTTGGIGLRSAIKVIQDILVDRSEGMVPIAEQEVGWLASTVTLYDVLEKDIKRAYPSLHQSVGRVSIRFPNSMIHINISKTICVLQVLGNIPISFQNISSLMHSGIQEISSIDEARKAIEELVSDPIVPLGEQEGHFRFFSEKLNEIEQKRANLIIKSIELRKIQNEILKEVYTCPTINIQGTLSIQSGLKSNYNGLNVSIDKERNTIQTIIEFVDPINYETTKSKLMKDSWEKNQINNVFLLGRMSDEIEEKANEIVRAIEISNLYRSEPDPEVKDYCSGQVVRAERLKKDLERLIKKSLLQGSFFFRGEVTAVESLSQDLTEASKKHLSLVAEQVFDRYAEAPLRAGTDLAEKFLRLGNLSGITVQTDPLGLVQVQGGKASINTKFKAILSIRDMIDRIGSIDGKKLIEIFTDAPFGWSPDTLRYLISAMLVAGEIKLRVAGKEVKVNGQQAIDALKSNVAFRNVGISLRDERPDIEKLGRASERLTELSGEMVIPLENEISKASLKLFPALQHSYSPLAEKLRAMNLGGVDRLESITNSIRDILFNDASDVPTLLGVKDSDLYFNLKWASGLKPSLEQGLEETLKQLHRHSQEIESLPNTGIPGSLKQELHEEFNNLQPRLTSPDFYSYAPDLASTLTTIQVKVRDAVLKMADDHKNRLKNGESYLSRNLEWMELSVQERNNLLDELNGFSFEVLQDLSGLRQLVNQEFAIQQKFQDLNDRVYQNGQERKKEKIKSVQEKAKIHGKTKVTHHIKTQKQISSVGELEEFIQTLQFILEESRYAPEFELNIDWKENSLGEI